MPGITRYGPTTGANFAEVYQLLISQIVEHINDLAAAHHAGHLSSDPVGTITATDVQAAIDQIAAALASGAAGLAAHLADAVDSHDASAVSFTPTGTIAATDVQAAIAEIGTEYQAAIAAAVAGLVDSSPALLDTLNELAAALGDDPNFATTMTTALAGKVATNDPRLSDQRTPLDGSVTGPKLAPTMTDTAVNPKVFDFLFFRKKGDRVHVNAFGAKADGSTSNYQYFNAAQTSSDLPSSGATIELGSGTYDLERDVPIRRGSITWRGEGMHATVWRLSAASAGGMISASVAASHVTYEDMTFDLQSFATIIANISGNFHRRVTFRRCRFKGMRRTDIALNVTRAAGVTIEDCEFDGGGAGRGRAVTLSEGGRLVRFRRNRLLYLYDGLTVATGASTSHDMEMLQDLLVVQNEADMGWLWLVQEFSGEGASVSYTNPSGNQIVLTDTAAAFSGISTTLGDLRNVRVMPVLATGNLPNPSDNAEITGVGFVTNAVRRGDIIRAGTGFAIVSGVESDTKLRHEGWLSDTDRSPIAPPATGTAYTVYRVLHGRVSASTSTTLTIERLQDFGGNVILPPTLAAGTRYEVLPPHPNYNFLFGKGLQDFAVLDNVIRRGWSDQIGVQGGRRGIISRNLIEDGQDVGVTVSTRAYGVKVLDNDIRHQGSCGIWEQSDECDVIGNTITDWGWAVDPAFVDIIAGIEITNSNRLNADRNRVLRTSSFFALAKWGINVTNENGASADNTVANTRKGEIALAAGGAEVRVVGATTTGTRLRSNEGTTTVAASTGSVDFGTQRGAGSPEGVVQGSVGNRYERTDGGAGTSHYVKESGDNTTTGWVPVVAAASPLRMTADVAAPTNTRVALTGLSFAIGANQTRFLDIWLIYDTTTANDIQVGFSLPSGATFSIGGYGAATSATTNVATPSQAVLHNAASGSASYGGGRAAGGAPVKMIAHLVATVTAGATAGTVQVTAGKINNTDTASPADDCTIFAGSRMIPF